jgi:predicted TIM-barrel fold metal-dependent hydrolase
MTLFDANAWIGSWPFSLGATHDARSLAAELRTHGIGEALVSPLAAVLAPEPGPANRVLLHDTRGGRGLIPVPVVNPALPGWRDELSACAADERVRAVRVLPAYHAYRADGPALREFAREVRARGLRLIVQARLIDERHEFHAMQLKPVPTKQLAAFLAHVAPEPVLVCGLTRAEVHALAPEHANLRADLSFAEWLEPVRDLRRKARTEQLVFGSNTPILMPGAQAAKLATASAAERRAVGRGNLERFLRG